MKRIHFLKYAYTFLLFTILSAAMTAHAGNLRAVKEKQPDYTYTSYYNKKTNKFSYATINLVVKKSNGTEVLASQLKNLYRPGYKALFKFTKLDAKNKIYNKNGKYVPFSRLKKGTKIRVTFDGYLLESSPLQFQKIKRIDLR